MKKLIIHLISESSGQTVKHTADTALTKFSDVEVKKYHWPMIRNQKMLEEVLKKIKLKPGIVLYTISSEIIRNDLKRFCYEKKIPCISVVSRIVNEISKYLGTNADSGVVYNNKFDESYFDKVDAIEYTLRHDDGQTFDDLDEADIILIGPSRTSKTPTSIYLAYNGFKTANIPFVYNCPFPEFLPTMNNSLIFGLLINPMRLIEIRESRMNLLQVKESSDYTDIKTVQDECREVRKLCSKNNWKTIDVTMRSIEETAAIIMKAYYENQIRNK
ncbi:MAG: kinase/pyrophosphorylase [Rickettsiales bacterium]|nr:MAG: kinase/pyrophosphorylase [Rickettsiales bacterium]